MGKRWIPLESNPDVLNTYVAGLGAQTDQYAFCDVYGVDPVCKPLTACSIRRKNHSCFLS